MAETTLVLAQALGSTPDPTKASWRSNLGGEGLVLPAGSVVSVSDAVIDVGADDSATSYVFTEDISETIEFEFWIQDSTKWQVWEAAPGSDPNHDHRFYKIYRKEGGTVATEPYKVTTTITVPAGKYEAGALADYISRTTRTPSNVPSFATLQDGLSYKNDFLMEIGYTDADNTWHAYAPASGVIPARTMQLRVPNKPEEVLVGSNQGFAMAYDTVAGAMRFTYLHSPMVSATGEIGVQFEQSTDLAESAVVGMTGLAITQWTTKTDWSQTLWARMGFTQEQLASQSFGFRTCAQLTPALTTSSTTGMSARISADQFSPQPLVAAYDNSGNDRALAEGTPVTALSPAWSVRVRELYIDWRRDAEHEGSLARVTRSFSSAGFVFGAGSRSYTLTHDVIVQSLHVEILNSSGSVSTELGGNNSVTLDFALPESEA